MRKDVKIYVSKRRIQIAQRIHAARSKHGWTQEQAADYLGCSRRRFNRVERGIAELSIGEIELLAAVFDVPVSYFFEISDNFLT